MHSSRLRTAYLLPVSPSMHCTGGVCFWGGCLLPGGVSASLGVSASRGGCSSSGGCLLPGGGCLLPRGLLLGGVCFPGVSASGGCLLLGGVYFWGVLASWGWVSASGGGWGCLLLGVSQHALRQTPPREQTGVKT